MLGLGFDSVRLQLLFFLSTSAVVSHNMSEMLGNGSIGCVTCSPKNDRIRLVEHSCSAKWEMLMQISGTASITIFVN